MRARSSPIPCSARVRRRKCRVGASPDLRAANKACFREVVENRESGAGGDAHGCGDVGDARVRHARHRQEHVPVVGEQGPRRTRGHGGHGVAATGVRRHTGSGSVSFVSVAREGGFSGTGISRRSWPWYPVPRGFALLVEGTDEELTRWTTALAARLTGLGVEGEVVELSV